MKIKTLLKDEEMSVRAMNRKEHEGGRRSYSESEFTRECPAEFNLILNQGQASIVVSHPITVKKVNWV